MVHVINPHFFSVVGYSLTILKRCFVNFTSPWRIKQIHQRKMEVHVTVTLVFFQTHPVVVELYSQTTYPDMDNDTIHQTCVKTKTSNFGVFTELSLLWSWIFCVNPPIESQPKRMSSYVVSLFTKCPYTT